MDDPGSGVAADATADQDGEASSLPALAAASRGNDGLHAEGGASAPVPAVPLVQIKIEREDGEEEGGGSSRAASRAADERAARDGKPAAESMITADLQGACARDVVLRHRNPC